MQYRMKRIAAACVCLLAFAAPPASAIVTVTTTGSVGTAIFVDGVTPTFSPPFTGNFETLIGDKSFTSAGELTHTVTVPALGDLHFAGGLRWVETVRNDTATSWTGFTFTLEDSPPLFFPDTPGDVPTFVTLTGSGAGVTNVALDGDVLANGWTIQNATDTMITVDFSSAPLAAGGSFSVYFALLGVPLNQPFGLVETAIAVPEPSALALAGLALAGLGLFGAAGLRRFPRSTREEGGCRSEAV